jgi:hypothetical protein
MSTTTTDTIEDIAVRAVVSLYKTYLTGTLFDYAFCRASSNYHIDTPSKKHRTEVFYDPKHVDLARQMCLRCTVRRQCLVNALLFEVPLNKGKTRLADSVFGVWGGSTPQERNALVEQITVGQLIDLTFQSDLASMQNAAQTIRMRVLEEDDRALNLTLGSLRRKLHDVLDPRKV